MRALTSGVFGFIFGVGLITSGMTDPNRILAFLDIAGDWDPSLALVMATAIAVAAPVFAIARTRRSAALGDPISLPDRSRPIDATLVTGAATFGLGWGLSGLCPGPSIVLLSTVQSKPFIFVGAVLAGFWLSAALRSGRPEPDAAVGDPS
jgi:uncharacterized membrane protein YedE/YeeE